jgi:hypothetical protein
MKKLAILCAILALGACTSQEEFNADGGATLHHLGLRQVVLIKRKFGDMCTSEDDIKVMRFTAVNFEGTPVSGLLCKSMYGGYNVMVTG